MAESHYSVFPSHQGYRSVKPEEFILDGMEGLKSRTNPTFTKK